MTHVIRDLAPGSLVIMRHHKVNGEHHSATDPYYVGRLYVIIERLKSSSTLGKTVFQGHRYMTTSGIIRLYEADFGNCDDNKVVI